LEALLKSRNFGLPVSFYRPNYGGIEMSLTYPNETETLHDDAVYTPVYARGKTRGKKKGVKTWMILAPVGGVVLMGGAAMMLLDPSNEAAPLVEAETPVVSAMAPIAPEPSLLDSAAPAPATAASAPAPVAVTPVTPVGREAAPVRRTQAAPDRRVAEPVAAPVAEVETAAPSGPQPYAGTSALNTTASPVQATPVTTPAPAITVQPLN
jgi:hypothetical protein